MKQLTNIVKLSTFAAVLVTLAINFGSCKKSSNYIEPITPPADTTIPVVYTPSYDLDSVIGTYIVTDTHRLRTSSSYPDFDTVVKTWEVTITARGTNMIQFDTLLNDNPKYTNHRYTLDTACTFYKYYTSYNSGYYYGSFYQYSVDVYFNGDTMNYKIKDETYNYEYHMGKGIKRR